jgi:hypothetical protein
MAPETYDLAPSASGGKLRGRGISDFYCGTEHVLEPSSQVPLRSSQALWDSLATHISASLSQAPPAASQAACDLTFERSTAKAGIADPMIRAKVVTETRRLIGLSPLIVHISVPRKAGGTEG